MTSARVESMYDWTKAVRAETVDQDDVLRFDHGDRTFAIFCSADDRYFATDGFCTHERAHLADGLVMGFEIECPKHNGVFDYRTGKAKGAPVSVNLRTYPVQIRDGWVFIDLS